MDTPLETGDLFEVYNELISAQHVWFDIGLALKLDASDLKAINGDHQDTKSRLRETLRAVLEKYVITWRDIVNALNSSVVRHNVLATKIENKHSGKF